MELIISKLVSSVLQIVLFTLVPFIWWLATARKKESFFSWIGFKKIDKASSKNVGVISSVVAVCFMLLSFFILFEVKGIEAMATSDFTDMGASAIPAIIVYAVLNTSLPEEILFRGFLLKRISNRFGFGVANFIQSVVFGMMHGLMFVKYTGVVTGTAITVFTTAIAWAMGYINEKKANGSILPSWGMHAAANIFSGMVSAFSII